MFSKSSSEKKFVFSVPQDKMLLPFPGVSRDFYKLQGKNWAANNLRNLERTNTTVVEENNETIGRCKGTKIGTLEENIAELESMIQVEKNVRRTAELKSIVAVAKELKASTVLGTHGAFEIYWENKNLHLNTQHRGFYRASDTYQILSRHLNIAQVIVAGKGYLCESHNTDITKLQKALTTMFNEQSDNAFVSQVRTRLDLRFETALRCLDTKKDRDIFIGVFAKMTSANTVMHLRTVKDRTAIVRQALRTDALYRNYVAMQKSVLSVRNDMTNSQQQQFEKKS